MHRELLSMQRFKKAWKARTEGGGKGSREGQRQLQKHQEDGFRKQQKAFG